MTEGERTLAVFIDFENLALGFKGKKEKRILGRGKQEIQLLSVLIALSLTMQNHILFGTN